MCGYEECKCVPILPYPDNRSSSPMIVELVSGLTLRDGDTKKFYSDKEFEMIKMCSPHWASLIEKGVSITSIPPNVLDCVVMEVFLENKQGHAVDSLRKCVNALKNSKLHRMTPEYDSLIVLE